MVLTLAMCGSFPLVFKHSITANGKLATLRQYCGSKSGSNFDGTVDGLVF
jgi:hypothetical protein